MSIDLSLHRLHQLVAHLPPYTRPTLHIAGTNGKGSVSAIISAILRASSLSVGRFNSPHLVSIYDSITLDNKPVDPSMYTAARAKIIAADEQHETHLSNFELLTLTALSVFEELRIDIAIVEVGMGGRLDATNIIPDDAIVVSLLTAVDLDHQGFLGPTISAIAKEKVGIARPSRPFVLGPQPHKEVEQIVRETVLQVGGTLLTPINVQIRPWNELIDGPHDLTPFSFTKLPFAPPMPQPVTIYAPCFAEPIQACLPLHGDHQLDNLSTAITGISALLSHRGTAASRLDFARRITPTTLAQGIKNTRWLGRLSFHTIPVLDLNEVLPLVVLADGAHNPASSATLSAYINHLLGLLTSRATGRVVVNLMYILALSHSPPKTPLQTLSPLLPPHVPIDTSHPLDVNTSVACLRFTPPEGMPWVKCVPPNEVAKTVQELMPEAQIWVSSDTQLSDKSGYDAGGSLDQAFRWVASLCRDSKQEKDEAVAEDLVIVAGSLYLVGDLYRLLDNLVGMDI